MQLEVLEEEIVWETTIVSRKYAPPTFAILALVQNTGGGGLYARCDNFSRDYALPSGKAWPHLGLPMWKINLRISNNLYHVHEELTDA